MITINKKQFESIMFTKVQTFCDSIKKYYHISYKETLNMLYHSKLYEMIGDEETKMWYYSNHDLLKMFVEEKETGTFTIYEG